MQRERNRKYTESYIHGILLRCYDIKYLNPELELELNGFFSLQLCTRRVVSSGSLLQILTRSERGVRGIKGRVKKKKRKKKNEPWSLYYP